MSHARSRFSYGLRANIIYTLSNSDFRDYYYSLHLVSFSRFLVLDSIEKGNISASYFTHVLPFFFLRRAAERLKN